MLTLITLRYAHWQRAASQSHLPPPLTSSFKTPKWWFLIVELRMLLGGCSWRGKAGYPSIGQQPNPKLLSRASIEREYSIESPQAQKIVNEACINHYKCSSRVETLYKNQSLISVMILYIRVWQRSWCLHPQEVGGPRRNHRSSETSSHNDTLKDWEQARGAKL